MPSSGVHSNGLTLARRALLDDGGLGLDERPAELAGASVADVLLEPTVIYVRAALDLLRSDIPVHGLAHITGGGLENLLRLGRGVGYAVEDPLPAPPVFGLVQRLGGVSDEEMHRVFNMGCGFVAIVPADRGGRRGGPPGRPPSGRAADRRGHRPRRRGQPRLSRQASTPNSGSACPSFSWWAPMASTVIPAPPARKARGTSGSTRMASSSTTSITSSPSRIWPAPAMTT